MVEDPSNHLSESPGVTLSWPRLVLVTLVVIVGVGYAGLQVVSLGTASLTLVFTDEHFQKNDMSGRPITVEAEGRSFSFFDGESTDLYEGDVERQGEEFVFKIDQIASGRRALLINVEGYAVTSAVVNLKAGERVRRPLLLSPNFGMAEVVIVDAQRNVDISAQSIAIANGDEKPGAEALFALAPGGHVVSAMSRGYCRSSKEILVEAKKTSYPRILLSREVSGGVVARIVLEWGRVAKDLDAHLIVLNGPISVDNQHIYHTEKSANILTGGLMARLHRDDRAPEGVEVVSIYHGALGVFGYYVHLFEGGRSLIASEALVSLFRNTCQSLEYRVPEDCAADLWHVFNLRIGVAGVAVDSVNRCVGEQEYSKWLEIEKVKK